MVPRLNSTYFFLPVLGWATATVNQHVANFVMLGIMSTLPGKLAQSILTIPSPRVSQSHPVRVPRILERLPDKGVDSFIILRYMKGELFGEC